MGAYNATKFLHQTLLEMSLFSSLRGDALTYHTCRWSCMRWCQDRLWCTGCGDVWRCVVSYSFSCWCSSRWQFSGNCRAAFLACRKYRVDLNVLAEIELKTFVQSIPSFVKQLYDADHINLFLSGLRCALCPGVDLLIMIMILLPLQSINTTTRDN